MRGLTELLGTRFGIALEIINTGVTMVKNETLRKFLAVSGRDRHLLVSAVFLLGAIRLGLWLLPFQTLNRLLQKITQLKTEVQEVNSATVDRVAWAVMVASRYIPGALCLAQALAAQVLLGWRGYQTDLRIGVARKKGQLRAHAWVQSRGKIVIGGLGNLYTPVPIQKTKSA